MNVVPADGFSDADLAYLMTRAYEGYFVPFHVDDKTFRYFVDTGGDSTTGSRVLSALTIFLMLGGSAWVVGRVRERYGRPPWPHRPGGSQ